MEVEVEVEEEVDKDEAEEEEKVVEEARGDVEVHVEFRQEEIKEVEEPRRECVARGFAVNEGLAFRARLRGAEAVYCGVGSSYLRRVVFG